MPGAAEIRRAHARARPASVSTFTGSPVVSCAGSFPDRFENSILSIGSVLISTSHGSCSFFCDAVYSASSEDGGEPPYTYLGDEQDILLPLEPHLHALAALIAEHPDRTLVELKDGLGTPAVASIDAARRAPRSSVPAQP